MREWERLLGLYFCALLILFGLGLIVFGLTHNLNIAVTFFLMTATILTVAFILYLLLVRSEEIENKEARTNEIEEEV